MTYHVQGKLTPLNSGAVNENTRELIRRAAIRHQLTFGITDIYKGVITINGSFGFFGKGADIFLQALNSFVQDKAIVGLDLQGQVLITGESVEDTAYSPITVKEGQVFHSHPRITGNAQEVALPRTAGLV